MLRNRLKTRLAVSLILIAAMASTNVFAQYQQESEETPRTRRQQEEVYSESALRRFEIVTLVSLPFTAIHSFLMMRGIQMIRQNEFAPELTGKNFRIIGASAVSLALFIGVWDWLHTHDKDPSQPLMPNSTPPPPPQRVELNDWDVDDSDGLVVPLVHFRF
ncbi:MAG: hypothetical protein O7E52_30085 [Candidatus Poribacteria bacterium]|nr:hypothetical protein [Candidatus Poribacteria bacterium]